MAIRAKSWGVKKTMIGKCQICKKEKELIVSKLFLSHCCNDCIYGGVKRMRNKKFCRGCREELLIESQRRIGKCPECELE